MTRLSLLCTDFYLIYIYIPGIYTEANISQLRDFSTAASDLTLFASIHFMV